MIAMPKFSEADLAREKKVVINEQANERDKFDIVLSRFLFRNHPLALPIEGTRVIAPFSSRRMKRWHKLFFQPQRMALIVVGELTLKKIVDLIMRSELSSLNCGKLPNESATAEINWDKEHEIGFLDINRSALIYPLPAEPRDLVIFDHIMVMVSDISTLGARWEILRPLGLHEGMETGASFSFRGGYAYLDLSALSQEVLLKLEKRTISWLSKVTEKGLPHDLFARTYKQAINRFKDKFSNVYWWHKSLNNMVVDGTLSAADAYFMKEPLSADEVKKEMERVFRNVFGGKRVIIRSFVKK
jgi:hypothetical protein